MGTDTVKNKKSSRKKELRRRRKSGVLCAAASLAAGGCAYLFRERFIMYVLAAAAVLLAVEAVLLCIKKKAPGAVYISLFVLSAALLMYSPMQFGMVRLMGGLPDDTTSLKLTDVPNDSIRLLGSLEKLDVTDPGVTDMSFISELSTLRQVDARGNSAFTDETYAELNAVLPDCEFIYSREIAGSYHDSNETVIDVSATPMTPDDIAALCGEYPDKEFVYSVLLWNEVHGAGETSLVLPDGAVFDRDEFDGALRLMKDVGTVDLTARPFELESVKSLTEAYPDIKFSFIFPVGNETIPSDIAELTVSGSIDEYRGYFPYMPSLKKVSLGKTKVTRELVDGLIAENPDVMFDFDFSLFGVKVNSLTEKVKIDDKKVGTVENFESYLKYMPKLTAISMCDCGLTDTEMAALNDKYPDIRFVWKVHCGKFSVRTDATMFSTLYTQVNNNNYGTGTFEPLKYCTDLMLLDLGHNVVTDLSFISGLTKLRVLILACNRVTDITPLAELKDLEYIELFENGISDITPLAGLGSLKDLNICGNPIGSFNALKSCTSLERLWVGNCGMTREEYDELRTALPGCAIQLPSGDDSTGKGWRNHARYYVIREMYEKKRYIPFE